MDFSVGLYEMYGEHLRLCIYDYVKGYKLFNNKSKKEIRKITESSQIKKQRYANYKSAKKYLFGGLLEESINKFGLPLESDYIKKYVTDIVKGKATLKRNALTKGINKRRTKGEIEKERNENEQMYSVWGDNNSENESEW